MSRYTVCLSGTRRRIWRRESRRDTQCRASSRKRGLLSATRMQATVREAAVSGAARFRQSARQAQLRCWQAHVVRETPARQMVLEMLCARRNAGACGAASASARTARSYARHSSSQEEGNAKWCEADTAGSRGKRKGSFKELQRAEATGKPQERRQARTAQQPKLPGRSVFLRRSLKHEQP